MSRRCRTVLTALLSVNLIAASNAIAQLPTDEVIELASQSVVKVSADECRSGQDASATGFVWGRSNQVVTALHLVAGCQRIVVRSEHAGAVSRATIRRSLREADLVLLAVDNAWNLTPLSRSERAPGLNADIVALGYELDAPSIGSVNLKVSFGSSRLSDMLPPVARREIDAAGMPSLSIDVIRHQGHLVPGLSGAPVLDQRGHVVGVADGGLENGAASIGWAVPVSYLDRLLGSTEVVTAATTRVRQLFAAEIDSARGATIRCGSMDFTRLRTRSYAALLNTSDDPEGLSFFTQLAQLSEVDIEQLEFDVFVHLPTGATLVLPAGLEVSAAGASCVGSAFDGKLQIYFRGTWPQQTELASLQFMNDTMIPSGLKWSPEPGFVYTEPRTRFDGLTVHRGSFSGFSPDDPGLLFGMPTIRASAFETNLARNDAFLGLVIFNRDSSTFMPAPIMYCRLMPDAPGCSQLLAEIHAWIGMLIGAYFSTFPIG